MHGAARRADDESRVPRVLPAVLQPPRPAPPCRSRPLPSASARGLSLTRRGGATDSFAAIPTTPPFNLAGFVLSSPTFPLSGLTEIDTAAAFELIDVDFPDSFARYDGESAAAFLDRLRFPAEARHLALEVFARSFFADPDDFSAGELVAMFHTYFAGSSEGLLFDVPTDDYDTALWAPLGDHLADLGVRIETDRTATALRCGPRRWTVTTDSGEVDSDAVVLAADPAAARRLVATRALTSPRRPSGRAGSPPPATRPRSRCSDCGSTDPSTPTVPPSSGRAASTSSTTSPSSTALRPAPRTGCASTEGPSSNSTPTRCRKPGSRRSR
ncbi:hypothetical protein IOD13_00240 [Brevibacterium casei]|nr:hypothetical protein [Brevibacterium casei]